MKKKSDKKSSRFWEEHSSVHVLKIQTARNLRDLTKLWERGMKMGFIGLQNQEKV